MAHATARHSSSMTATLLVVNEAKEGAEVGSAAWLQELCDCVGGIGAD